MLDDRWCFDTRCAFRDGRCRWGVSLVSTFWPFGETVFARHYLAIRAAPRSHRWSLTSGSGGTCAGPSVLANSSLVALMLGRAEVQTCRYKTVQDLRQTSPRTRMGSSGGVPEVRSNRLVDRGAWPQPSSGRERQSPRQWYCANVLTYNKADAQTNNTAESRTYNRAIVETYTTTNIR
jgi:hypothetical protein